MLDLAPCPNCGKNAFDEEVEQGFCDSCKDEKNMSKEQLKANIYLYGKVIVDIEQARQNGKYDKEISYLRTAIDLREKIYRAIDEYYGPDAWLASAG